MDRAGRGNVYGFNDAVRLPLKHGTDISVVDSSEKSPLDANMLALEMQSGCCLGTGQIECF